MNYKIPLFELNFDEAEEKAVLDTMRSKWISTGPKTVEFENKFVEKLLDEAQRGSWQSVKDNFWDDLNRRIKDDNE
ncbi:MAG: hypothetical protein R6W90_15370 [Ignavibacteriaceae bacterium]